MRGSASQVIVRGKREPVGYCPPTVLIDFLVFLGHDRVPSHGFVLSRSIGVEGIRIETSEFTGKLENHRRSTQYRFTSNFHVISPDDQRQWKPLLYSESPSAYLPYIIVNFQDVSRTYRVYYRYAGRCEDAPRSPNTFATWEATDSHEMNISLVAAVAANGVIGADGDVPWHLPADLEHFKQTTLHYPVIVGRRTFETIYRQLGRPLPERENIVLTNRPESVPGDVAAVQSVEDAVRLAEQTGTETAYVVGGASVYRQFLPRADGLILTELERAYEGDTTFPAVEWEEWRETRRQRRDEFDIVWYARRSSTPDRTG